MMATSSAPDLSKEALSKLQSQLTCAICLDRYKDPRALPCTHSYCKDCISHLPVERPGERQRVVKCPLCQQSAQLAENGSSGLPIAFHINNLLEIDELLKKVPTHGNVDEHKQQTRLPAEESNRRGGASACSFRLQREREMREVEEAVQKDIDDAYQALMSKLEESRMRLSQEAFATLQEKMKLHLSQRANVETVLAKMKSCKLNEEEESLSQAKSVKTDEFKCEMQADMKQLSITETHSSERVKVSELQPTQELNIMFILDKKMLSACGHIGEISSKLSNSLSVELPTRILVDRKTMVAIQGPTSLEASRLSCELYTSEDSLHSTCPVTSVGEGRFKVMIRFTTAGLHQLRVLVDGVDIHGSPFSVHVVEWRKKNDVYNFASLGSPWDIAVTDDGQYIVTECTGNCVTVFSKKDWPYGRKEVVRNFSGFGGRLIQPKSIAMSADCKNIFVATETGVEKYCLLTSAYEGSHTIDCAGLALHPVSGKLYCIDRDKGNVAILNDDLTPSHTLNVKMPASSVMPACRDLAIDSKGMLYIVSSSGVVLKFTPEGEYYATIGSAGDQNYQFGKPGCICIDSNDIMYVTDIQKCHIMMFTTEGEYLEDLRAYNDSNWYVSRCELHGVAVDKTGNVFVCNSNKQVLYLKHQQ